LGLEIPVIYKIYGGRKYLDRPGERDRAARRQKDEIIPIDGQEKRKPIKREKTISKKKRKKKDLIVCKSSKMLLGVRSNNRDNNKIMTSGPNKVAGVYFSQKLL